MNQLKPVKSSKIFMGRLSHGTDLLEEITQTCIDKEIRLGRIEAIGAVVRARIGYYDQSSREYQYNEINEPLEITVLLGNVSIKDDRPMVHAHVTLADSNGNAFGGHLAEGTIVYACEVIIYSFDGPEFIREFDRETALSLWAIEP